MIRPDEAGSGPEYYFDHVVLEPDAAVKGIFLFLDFDGTLTPIQKDPGACVLTQEVKRLLASLAKSSSCRVSVLSGRSLADIKQRVPVDGVIYGGNHGLAIEGPGLSFVHPDVARAQVGVTHIRDLVETEISRIKGPWIEDKGMSFSLHYRGAGREASAEARKALKDALSTSAERSLLFLLRGKKALELLPRTSWDKGRAALYVLDALGDVSLPIYVGDDTTDESAFRAIGLRGITIRVGRSKRTSARYYLKGQGEITRFLREMERVCLALHA